MKQILKTILTKIVTFLKFFRSEVIRFPAYIMGHPLKGFEELKRYKRGKMSIAIFFIAFAVILQIMKFQYSGFAVSDVSIRDLRSFSQVIYLVGAVVILTVANWSVTTLFDGKGNMKDIFMMISYCLYPFIWASIFGMIISNVISSEEIAFYNLIISLGSFLSFYMFFFGLISIHEYGLGKTIATIILTLLAVLIVLFVGVLLFDLFQRVYAFFYQLWQEISLRN